MVFPTVQFLTILNPFPTYEIKGTPYVADSKMKSIPSSKSSLHHRIKQRKHFGNKKKSLKKNSTLQLDFLQQHIEKIRIERIKLSLENEELRLSLHNLEPQMAHIRNIPLETLDNQYLSDTPRSPIQDGGSTVSDSQSELEDDWMDEFLSTYQEVDPSCCHSLEANNWFSEDTFEQAVFVSNPQLKEWVLLFIILFLSMAIHNSQVLQNVTSLQFLLYSPMPVHVTRKNFPIKQMCPKR